MATTALTSQNFVDTVKNNSIVLVDFWAAWCGPCQRFGPIFEQASQRHQDAVFAKIDTEAEQELSAQLQIQAIPTLMAFKDGQLVYREAGLLNGAQLDKLIGQIEALDLDAAKAGDQKA